MSNTRPQLNIRLKDELTRVRLAEVASAVDATVQDLVRELIEGVLAFCYDCDGNFIPDSVKSDLKLPKIIDLVPKIDLVNKDDTAIVLVPLVLEIRTSVQALTERIETIEKMINLDSTVASTLASTVASSDINDDSTVASTVASPLARLSTIHFSAIDKQKVLQLSTKVGELAFERILIEAQSMADVAVKPGTAWRWLKAKEVPRGKYANLYRKILGLLLKETQSSVSEILR